MWINGLAIIVIASLLLMAVTRLAVERVAHAHHAQKVSFFNRYPVKPGDIVFLGDSITDGCRWDELFPGLPVKNRGINANLTTNVLSRMDNIVSGHPKAVFILIGTNDLPWFERRHDEQILETYEAILRRLKTETPETSVFVQSILPREKSKAVRIRKLNEGLKDLAMRYGYVYIDLFPHFATPEGQLRPELTNDSLHLLSAGYAIWAEILKPYLRGL
ncbi:lysophospholipase L1 [Longilinea arvoryzae]|uniref:Lysophospholipase L1 n=1 Tax=Longilinea arvoryzae TaxID=360412 RepID=A0A0S7B7J6_9CHLR|nr:GDSL-type esterase/lipase family protein [Longilinea arvoryzae]GAP13343.1 lysophospholipase L1 [Longilinea arvoryzae]